MIDLTPHADGVIVPVRAQPSARQNELRGVHAGALRVAVTAAPERGQANRAIVELLCDALSLKRSQVAVIAGHTASQKRLLVRGVGKDDLQRRIAAALDDDE